MGSLHPTSLRAFACAVCACALWILGAPSGWAGPQGNFVVDAGGSGDFVDLPEGVAQAPAGALLIVLPGEYAPFTLQKAMTLMGPAAGPKPFVAGVATVSDAPRATFQHMSFRGMQANDVEGALVFDDCRFGPEGCIPQPHFSPFHPPNALVVLRCLDVEISRCYASNAVGQEGTPHAALRAEQSAVRAYDSTFLGWSWGSAWSCLQTSFDGWFYEDGGQGIYAVGSYLEVSACEVKGGQATTACVPLACFDGKPGNAIRLKTSDLRLAVRVPGEVDSGSFAPAVRGEIGSSAWVAGGTWEPGELSGDASSFVQTRPATAIVTVVGAGGSGGARRPRVWAPLGAPGLLVLGFGQSGAFLPDWDGILHVNPALLLSVWPVVGKGLDDPETFLLTLPPDPALWGFRVELQGFFPTLPGVIDTSLPAMTNSAGIVIDF